MFRQLDQPSSLLSSAARLRADPRTRYPREWPHSHMSTRRRAPRSTHHPCRILPSMPSAVVTVKADAVTRRKCPVPGRDSGNRRRAPVPLACARSSCAPVVLARPLLSERHDDDPPIPALERDGRCSAPPGGGGVLECSTHPLARRAGGVRCAGEPKLGHAFHDRPARPTR
jgi:hypothetical protein